MTPMGRVLLALVLIVQLLLVPAAWAGPVNWQEVTATGEGRQWWDSGSLRRNREGHVTVLSRFQPSAADDIAPAAGDGTEPAPRRARNDGRLYVMELDCDQSLYRDTSVNGLPQFGAQWLPVGNDDLTAEVLRQACEAAPA
ncbi:MAG: hypothetical protein WAM11_12205 [Cyanobium sp.]